MVFWTRAEQITRTQFLMQLEDKVAVITSGASEIGRTNAIRWDPAATNTIQDTARLEPYFYRCEDVEAFKEFEGQVRMIRSFDPTHACSPTGYQRTWLMPHSCRPQRKRKNHWMGPRGGRRIKHRRSLGIY